MIMSGNSIDKLKKQLIEKLKNYDCYFDDELPDYIMVMVANKRTSSQMKEDLKLFIGKHVNEFVDWLQFSLEEIKFGKDSFVNLKPKKEKIVFNLNKEKSIQETKENSERNLTKRKIFFENKDSNELKRKKFENNEEIKIDQESKPNLISKISVVKTLNNNFNEKNSFNENPKNQIFKKENKIQKSLVLKAIEEANKSYNPKKLSTSSKEIKKTSILDRLGSIDETIKNKSIDNEYSARSIINPQSKNQIKHLIATKPNGNQNNLVFKNTNQISNNLGLKDLINNNTSNFTKIIENQDELDPRDLRHVLSKKNIKKNIENGKSFEKVKLPQDVKKDNIRSQINNIIKKDLNPKTINSSINLVKNTNNQQINDLKKILENKAEITKLSKNKDFKKERCFYWPACPNGDKCLNHHPKTLCLQFPLCKFGETCLNIHPNCKFDLKCSKKDCPFTHLNKKLLSTKKQTSSMKTNSFVNTH